VTPQHDLPGAPDHDVVPGAPAAAPGAWAGAHDSRWPVRPAHPQDVPDILAMVRELAEYERSAHEVLATEESLADLLFGSNTPSGSPAAFCHVIGNPDPQDGSGALAGIALWFLNTSTWTGRHGIYLEDLYVRPAFRGRGFGRDLMAALASICVERGYTRLEWSVLDWNTPALDFYRTLGARGMDEWTVHRVTGIDLTRLADSHRGQSSTRQ
jgi:GNAT superfamily N-acetyltransferase